MIVTEIDNTIYSGTNFNWQPVRDVMFTIIKSRYMIYIDLKNGTVLDDVGGHMSSTGPGNIISGGAQNDHR